MHNGDGHPQIRQITQKVKTLGKAILAIAVFPDRRGHTRSSLVKPFVSV